MRLFDIVDGIPFDGDDERILSQLVECGRLDRTDRIEFDDDHHRFIEFWTLGDRRFVTEYDVRYCEVPKVSADGHMHIEHNMEVGERHLCKCRAFNQNCYTPKEEWTVD